jgi:alpha-beta hydrolase superfamily lysophospholipase
VRLCGSGEAGSPIGVTSRAPSGASSASDAIACQAFFDAAGSTDKTLKLYDGHVHDLLNDVDKEVVMADIKDWIGARLSKPVKAAR